MQLDALTAILSGLAGGAEGFGSGYEQGLERKRKAGIEAREQSRYSSELAAKDEQRTYDRGRDATKDQQDKDKLTAELKKIADDREDQRETAILGHLFAKDRKPSPEGQELLNSILIKRGYRAPDAAMSADLAPPASSLTMDEPDRSGLPSSLGGSGPALDQALSAAQPSGDLFLPPEPEYETQNVANRGVVQRLKGSGGPFVPVPGGEAVPPPPTPRKKDWIDSSTDRQGRVMQTYSYEDDKSPIKDAKGKTQTRLKPVAAEKADKPSRTLREDGSIVDLMSGTVVGNIGRIDKPQTVEQLTAAAKALTGTAPGANYEPQFKAFNAKAASHATRLIEAQERGGPKAVTAEARKILKEVAAAKPAATAQPSGLDSSKAAPAIKMPGKQGAGLSPQGLAFAERYGIA